MNPLAPACEVRFDDLRPVLPGGQESTRARVRGAIRLSLEQRPGNVESTRARVRGAMRNVSGRRPFACWNPLAPACEVR